MNSRFLPVLIAALVSFNVAFAADPAGTAEIPTATKDVLVIKESHATQTIDAAGRDVTVNGSHDRLTITGECHALTVSGGDNVVTVAAVSSISLVGGDNRVTWSKAVGGEKPQITDQGKGNTVSNK